MTYRNLESAFAALAMSVTLCGCSISHTYDVTGGPGATAQNAGTLVIPNKHEQPVHPVIRSVDGIPVDWLDQDIFDDHDFTLRLSPGRHRVLFGFTEGVDSKNDIHSEKDKAVTLVASAGKTYRFVIWYIEESDADGDVRSNDAKDLLQHTVGPSRSWRAKVVEVETSRETATDTP